MKIFDIDVTNFKNVRIANTPVFINFYFKVDENGRLVAQQETIDVKSRGFADATELVEFISENKERGKLVFFYGEAGPTMYRPSDFAPLKTYRIGIGTANPEELEKEKPVFNEPIINNEYWYLLLR